MSEKKLKVFEHDPYSWKSKCPPELNGKRVAILLRDELNRGQNWIDQFWPANEYRWDHDPSNPELDIVAYKIEGVYEEDWVDLRQLPAIDGNDIEGFGIF